MKIIEPKSLICLMLVILPAFSFPNNVLSQADLDKSAERDRPKSSPLSAHTNNKFEQANTLYKAGKYSPALALFRNLADGGDDDGQARIMAGTCLYQMKNYKAALAEYKQAAKEGKLISTKNKAQKLASTLDCYMKGICPGNCLKASTPGWRKMKVPGTPDRLVWMVFPYQDAAGKGGSEYWSNDHIGEVIEYKNGRPVNMGKCPICHGTTHVSLPN